MNRVWHKGPPPHVGWWNARSESWPNNINIWGWWDGCGWSEFCDSIVSAEIAAKRAKCRGAIYDGDGILWTDYYPENARVPRIDPRK